MKEKLKQLFGLFGAFAVVGVTTFGGGYAMLPALQREVVEKRSEGTRLNSSHKVQSRMPSSA